MWRPEIGDTWGCWAVRVLHRIHIMWLHVHPTPAGSKDVPNVLTQSSKATPTDSYCTTDPYLPIPEP